METIYEDEQKGIKITIDNKYDQEFLKFTEGILWGTENLVYKINNVESEFKKYKDAWFISLRENDELAGIRVLNHKEILHNGVSADVFYKSLLATDPTKMNKGYGTLILDRITTHIFSNFDRAFLFAFVEEDNIRSKRAVIKANYEHIAVFSALSHICLMPKANKDVSKLGKGDEPEMLSLLNKLYSSHTFVDVNESFEPDSYYVLKENNEIKAGLQVKVTSWSFVNFSGLYGFFLMKMVPKIPLLKKIFNPKNQRFLKIGNVYITDGNSFSKLLHAVLHLHDVNISLACLNPDSDIDSKIITQMKKGILSSVASKVNMFSKSKNITVNDLGVTRENCFYSNF
jgi:hypothetical protein